MRELYSFYLSQRMRSYSLPLGRHAQRIHRYISKG